MNQYLYVAILIVTSHLAAENITMQNVFNTETTRALQQSNGKIAPTESSVQYLFRLCHQSIIPEGNVLIRLSPEQAPELHRLIRDKCALQQIASPIHVYYSNDEENSDVKYALHNNHASILLHKKTISLRDTQQLEKTLVKVIEVIKEKLNKHNLSQITQRSPIALSGALWLMYSLISRTGGIRGSVDTVMHTLFALTIAFLATRPVTSFCYGNVTTELEDNLFERSHDAQPKLILHPETLSGIDEIRTIQEFIINFKKRRELYACLDRDKLTMIRGENLD